MGAAKTPKAVIQLLLAVATDKSTHSAGVDRRPRADSQAEAQFEAIAEARKISALSAMWERRADCSGDEFEQIGWHRD